MCQLHTKYIEGIYDNPVTLKSSLTVAQGHWKWNHWVDNMTLTISQVIWQWILSWPWNVGQRSLKFIENGTIWKLRYSFLFVFLSNYGRIFCHFGDIQRQRMIWPWNLGLGSFKVTESGAVRWTMYDFLLVCQYNNGFAIVTMALFCTVFELFDVE